MSVEAWIGTWTVVGSSDRAVVNHCVLLLFLISILEDKK
jgi:hypothetical protein